MVVGMFVLESLTFVLDVSFACVFQNILRNVSLCHDSGRESLTFVLYVSLACVLHVFDVNRSGMNVVRVFYVSVDLAIPAYPSLLTSSC